MTSPADRYAKAFFLLTKSEDYRPELNGFLSLLQKNPSIDRFFNSPHIPFKPKAQVLEKAVKSNVLVFLKLLLKKQRFSFFPEIVEEYNRLVREKLGIAQGFLKSALPLNEEQKKALSDKLQQYTGKKIELEVAIDPHLIGGGVLELNHHLIDFSVKGKLARLEEELIK